MSSVNFSRFFKDSEINTRNASTSKKKKATHQSKEFFSPDGKKRQTILRYHNDQNSLTSVSISFAQASTIIYGKMNLDPDLTATWKNNETTIITTTKDNVQEEPKYHQIQSFNKTITIEYIEVLAGNP